MDNEILKALENVPPEVLKGLTFSIPWQHDPGSDNDYSDPDGFEQKRPYKSMSASEIRDECWNKFDNNPQINTAIRGLQGRLTGLGFGCSSPVFTVQEVLDETWFDYRNRLYNFMPKYVAREKIEGELFLIFTIHEKGFVEIDFLDPDDVGGGKDDVGIIYHSTKKTMPLFYNIKGENPIGRGFSYQIPSIYIAHNPSLVADARKHDDFLVKAQAVCKSRKKVYQKLNGYYRFVVGWDRGLIERRVISYLRTVLRWANLYEQLKNYEIDHKRSAGSYLWVFTIEDPAAFKLWLSLSDEDRRKTGIMAKKTPGGSMVLPNGITMEAKSPSLPTLNEQDTDILKMVGSGLNEEEGVMTGKSTSPYASIKASRGPMSDRTSDEIAWFKNFLQFDFWGSVFLLKNKVGSFPATIPVEECVDFTSVEKKGENGEIEYNHTPVFKKIPRKPEFLIDISFPTSENIDYESRAKGMIGVKHGPLTETLGVPNSEVANRMGFSNYGRGRLQRETERKKYPKLVYTMDAESKQEKAEAEPAKSNKKEEKDGE